MPPTPYTEDPLVQQTTAEYLERKLGWESLHAYNKEDFGPDGLLGRESDREGVLTRILRAKIEEFNPGLPAAYSDEDIRDKAEAVFVHVFRAYPTVPSPYYTGMAS